MIYEASAYASWVSPLKPSCSTALTAVARVAQVDGKLLLGIKGGKHHPMPATR